MSLADDCQMTSGFTNNAPVPAIPPRQGKLNRIAEVRRQQSVSERSAARRLGVSSEQVRKQEDPTADLRLSELYAWQHALDVPISDLLMEEGAPLSKPVLDRARMLRMMKTVRAIKESQPDGALKRLVNMLEAQLLEVMPELDEVTAWHSVGQRRTQEEMGRVAERPISDDFVHDGLL